MHMLMDVLMGLWGRETEMLHQELQRLGVLYANGDRVPQDYPETKKDRTLCARSFLDKSVKRR
tara:strand:+ start:239 stop:427 length:189 start_codon:yes stop_codon:yes gene_type:complete